MILRSVLALSFLFAEQAKERSMRKLYLVAMALSFLTCIVSVVRFPFLGDALVLFHIDAFGGSFPLSLHSLVNCAAVLLLGWVFLKSWNNSLKVVGVKHSTVIERR